jgi:hypothetical protein
MWKGIALFAFTLLIEVAFLFHAALPSGVPGRAPPAAPAVVVRRGPPRTPAEAVVPAAATPAADDARLAPCPRSTRC